MKHVFFYETLIGRLGIAENGQAITNVFFAQSILPEDSVVRETALLKEARTQLEAYFAGKRKSFNLPLCPEGTAFQRRVWQALRTIPYGETCTYKQIAELIGQAGAYRAIGSANHKNPILILIPCHRVIGTNGELLGFAAGVALKKKLLTLEKGICRKKD